MASSAKILINLKLSSSRCKKINSVKRISHHVTWKQKTIMTYFRPIFDFMASVRHKKLRTKKMKMLKKYVCSSTCRCEEKINEFRLIEKSKEYESKLNIYLSHKQRCYIELITENLHKKMHGEEFSVPEKLMCLSIYHTSINVYNYLKNLIPIPDEKDLIKFSKSIQFDTGVTSTMLNRLLKISSTMELNQKIVVLMLNTIDITPHLHYSGKLDKIIGFEDWGHCQRDIIADKAFVFGIRGIESDWFLPVAYSFASEQPKISRLVKLLKQVVKCVKEAGFHIVAFVSNKNPWYDETLEKLRMETIKKRGPDTTENFGTILIQGLEIVPLLDPIDLLTNFRNVMFSFDLEYFIKLTKRPLQWDYEREKRILKGGRKSLISSWNHIQLMYFYSIESNLPLPPLNGSSISERELQKSEFNSVLDVFNEDVTSALELLSDENAKIEGIRFPPEGYFTSFMVYFLYKLCVALTGGRDNDDPKHALTTILTDGSFHHDFFEIAKIYFQHMRFVERETQNPVHNVSCFKDFTITIIGYQVLWRKLREMDFHFVKTKNFTMEPFDDFVRKHNGSTCVQFSREFKYFCYLDASL